MTAERKQMARQQSRADFKKKNGFSKLCAYNRIYCFYFLLERAVIIERLVFSMLVQICSCLSAESVKLSC